MLKYPLHLQGTNQNLMNTSDSYFPGARNETETIESQQETGRLLLPFTASQVRQYAAAIVFTYEHKNYGRGKRLWLSTFTPQERKTIASLHARAWAWEMRTGYPDKVMMQFTTYQLLARAGDFFNSI